jgi:hypothetical protein
MSDAQDAARLDWLERTGAQLYRRPDRLWNAVSGNRSRLGATPRAAIDAAMRDAAKSERAAENKVVPPSAEALAAANESHTSRQ